MTNQDLQNRLLALLDNGFTILAETERFVHQVQGQYRKRRIENGEFGWNAPRIFTLNSWMENFWRELWPSENPASSFLSRWKYLKNCLNAAPAPEPLTSDVELIRILDESFEHCLRYAIDPSEGSEVGQLIEWRRQVWRCFDKKLQQNGLFHPARLPEKILQCIESTDVIQSNGKMAFVGFEFAGYWEKRLLQALRMKYGVSFSPCPLAIPSRKGWHTRTRIRKSSVLLKTF